ncbi:MAG: PorT family protein [Cytophagaceae bacterium]|nr:PorT family protein [Cytophagaceae bacterium]
MKKLSVTLLLLTIFISGFSQEEKPKKIPKHKTVLSIGLTASPDIYIYDFKAYPNFTFDYNSKFNYSAGITVVYYPVKFISIRAAVLYSTKGFSLDYNYNVNQPNANPDSIKAKTNLVADYLDLPLILHLNLIHKDRIQLFVAGGIVPGLLVKKAEETLFKSNQERTTADLSKNFNDFIAGTIYSIGFKYNFSPKFGLGFDPYFRYYLNKIDKSAMSANPISFGGKVSLYINFIHKLHRGNWGK